MSTVTKEIIKSDQIKIPSVPTHILKYKSRINRQQDSENKKKVSFIIPSDIPIKEEEQQIQPPIEKITKDTLLNDYFNDVIYASKSWNIEHNDHELIVNSEIELQFLQTLRSLIQRQQNDVLQTYVKKVESTLKKHK
jgi:hypothetical protein